MAESLFTQTIDKTNQLLELMETDGLEEAQVQSRTRELLDSLPSTRGFFVSLLTGDWSFNDRTPEPIIKALSSSPDTVNEVLTKNLVMSTCMEFTHNENDDLESANGSKKVQAKVVHIIGKVSSESLKVKLESMLSSIEAKLNTPDQPQELEYVQFLTKWNYSEKQLDLARAKITSVLANNF